MTNSNLSNEGDFASEQVRITERFRFIDANTYIYEATYDDASVYSRSLMDACF